MKVVKVMFITVIVLLSAAAGLAKVMLAPQEVEFLQAMGWHSSHVVAFGLAQIVGAVLMISARTRFFAAIIVTAAFAVSAILLLMSGNRVFGLVSMLPVALSAVIAYQAR